MFYACASLKRVGVPVPVLREAIPGMDADLVTPPSRLGGDDGAEAEDEASSWSSAWWELLLGMTGRWNGVSGLGLTPALLLGCSSIFRYGLDDLAPTDGPWSWSSSMSSSSS